MKWQCGAALVGISILSVMFPAGCGDSGKTIEIRYDRPAELEISREIRRLGIAEFGGKTRQDRRWGDIASDQLAAVLDEYNRRYDRYELVDRKRLKAIMDERDLQIAISDTSTAVKLGKLARTDAMIYGMVSVMARDERGTKRVLDPINKRMKTVPDVRRYCLAAVNFTMDDTNTGKTLASVQVRRDYDSKKTKGTGLSMIAGSLGVGGGRLEPIDMALSRLVTECVEEFVGKISPHQIVVRAKLRKGASEIVRTGNKLAAAGEYREALELYQRAIRDEPDDHGAMFNAGLMCEALGDLKAAESFYDRAFSLKAEERYILSRRRVRAELRG